MADTLQYPLLDPSSPPSSSASNSSPSTRLWYTNYLCILLGPLVFVLLLLFLHIDDTKASAMVAAMSWVFIWWVTEALPLAVTALVPLFLLPFLEIESASTVSKSYTNDTVFLILGSFILANAVRAHNLHKRLAIRTVLLFGSDPRLLLFGFCIGSAFISMWVDNAPAAAMLIPMAVGVQQKIHAGFHPSSSEGSRANSSDSLVRMPSSTEDLEKLPPKQRSSNPILTMDPEQALKVEMDFCRAVVISIAVGVTIGGMATLTGNPVNLILTGIWETDFPNAKPIYYLQWMLFAVPFSVVLILVLWVLMCLFFCPPSAIKPVSASLHSARVEEELAKLGPMTSDQIIILIMFAVLIILWVTKTLTGNAKGWATLFDDYPANGTVTVLMAVLLFVIPSSNDPGQKIMNWARCKDLPWNIILLVGGGFALADGITSSGLSDVISNKMSFLKSTPYWAITPAIAVVTGVVTEFTSNSATGSVFIPLAAELALSMNRHPLYLMVPAALGSQLSYMLPIATGPNAIAYSTETIRVRDMAIPGFFLKIVGIIVLSILMPTLGALVFKTNSDIQI